MALSTEEAAVNTAATAYITAVEALFASLSAGDQVQFVPADVGDSAWSGNERSNNDTAVTTSFSYRHVVTYTNDGEFTIQIPVGPGGYLVPLVHLVTNSDNELA